METIEKEISIVEVKKQLKLRLQGTGQLGAIKWLMKEHGLNFTYAYLWVEAYTWELQTLSEAKRIVEEFENSAYQSEGRAKDFKNEISEIEQAWKIRHSL